MPGTIVAVISDTHIGSTTSLSLPTFTTDEGQEVKANKAQEWLFACWTDFTARSLCFVFRGEKDECYFS